MDRQVSPKASTTKYFCILSRFLSFESKRSLVAQFFKLAIHSVYSRSLELMGVYASFDSFAIDLRQMIALEANTW